MNGIQTRALDLLGNGVTPAQVAVALGVTESHISQMLSEEQFALAVAQRRYEKLQRHNETDDAYDAIEKQLLEKLKDCLGMMFNPDKILRAIQVINSAKRRGASAPDTTHMQQQIVTINMPVALLNQYIISSNSSNQITRVGEQDLVTIQPAQLLSSLKQRALTNEQPGSGKN